MKEDQKKITIFNKNGITIEKILTRNYKKSVYPSCSSEYISISEQQPEMPYHWMRKKGIPEYTTIKCVSKLGFYYNKSVQTKTLLTQKRENLSKKLRKVVIIGLDSDWVYNITYLISYHGTDIGHETRPWDLMGGSFPDNYMWGLLDDINNIFDELESHKIVKCGKNISSVRDLRRSVITELFGNPDGPKFQTNDEKILSHGFDLKTSFRNVKA